MSVVQRPDRHRALVACEPDDELAGGAGELPLAVDDACSRSCSSTSACSRRSRPSTFGWGTPHHDMTEAWAWGKEFQLGYAKHPPFTAWLVGGWFAVMPRTTGASICSLR